MHRVEVTMRRAFLPSYSLHMPLSTFLCQASQVADVVVSAHVDASVQAGTAHEGAKHHEDALIGFQGLM